MNGLYNPHEEHDACGVGFVAHLAGGEQRSVVLTALQAMARLAHRGGHAPGADNSPGALSAGDGAGILLPIPQGFFQRHWPVLATGAAWALGQLFMPQDKLMRESVLEIVRHSLAEQGLTVLQVRHVPVHSEYLHNAARETMPYICQLLVVPRHTFASDDVFERQLYVARRRMEKEAALALTHRGLSTRLFHVASLSCRSVVYKALLPGERLPLFYDDLQQDDFAAPFTIFHERFSTNTMPSWPLVQPFRHIAHNGEINTIRGNVLHMQAREAVLYSPLFGEDMDTVLPVIDEKSSDSGMFDNVVELLTHGGRSAPHALMMMVPEPFGQAYVMGDNKRAFYEYHAALMEPWDGPTAMVFTDGHSQVGALLDRNGLRPCRYSVSAEGLVVLASETGVVDHQADSSLRCGQLQPRRMIIADVQRHRMVPDAEIKGQVIRARPYRRWIQQYGVRLDALHIPEHILQEIPHTMDSRHAQAFGMSDYAQQQILLPMARNAQEPITAMGYDVPLAVLANPAVQPCTLFDYFKQQFAQVTNPPIDSQREELSMSLMQFAGHERNILNIDPEQEAAQCGMLRLQHPFLLEADMARLRACHHPQVRCATLDATFTATFGVGNTGKQLQKALQNLYETAEDALSTGASLLILSDTELSPERMAIPILLAAAGLHHHLLRRGLRHTCGIIVETGQAWEIMHMALLSAYGVSAVCPYLALRTVRGFAQSGLLEAKDYEAEAAYITALKKGMLKTMARLGISTLRNFRGGQCFEALGLSREIVDACFCGTTSRLQGIGFAELAREEAQRHALAFAPAVFQAADPQPPLLSQLMPHLWSVAAVRLLHSAVRPSARQSLTPTEAWQEYCAISDTQPQPISLRSLLSFVPMAVPVPLDEVEPAESIVRRFVGAAMSLGSLSTEAHETIAVAFNSLGACSNSGEGGEAPERGATMRGSTAKAGSVDTASRVRQIASGRFGVTAHYLAHASEIQIKIAQGAKPGEGGQLPAHKVTTEIARVRHTLPYVSLISPPPHHDIYSIEDLAQLIFDLRRIQPSARISVKLVAEAGIGTVAVGVAKAGADAVLVSGHDGGTGASPLSAVQHTGLPWEMGLSEVRQAFEHSGLRRHIRLQVDGLLRTGRDVVIAALLGAEEFGLGSTLLVSMGCIMCRKCHLGKCPAGIATQEPALRRRFTGKPEQVEAFLRFLAEDVRTHMAALGFRTVQEMVGRTDMLAQRLDAAGSKAATLDLHPLLCAGSARPAITERARAVQNEQNDFVAYGRRPAPAPPESELEQNIYRAALPVLSGLAQRCVYEGRIGNTDRAVGTRLAGVLARKAGDLSLRDNASIYIKLQGSAGQSLGAFLTSGVTIEVHGDANDYLGKGLSGGTLVVTPTASLQSSGLPLHEYSLVGNVALYGATAGQVYIAGMAGERFAVRNSGASAVVEGVGDHACEYMTGGTVVVLGSCGYNFAAGMSDGLAFVYDGDERFQNRCNTDSVELESVWLPEDKVLLRLLLEQHLQYTGSARAAAFLERWDESLSLFVKVVPLDYAAAIQRLQDSVRHGADTQANTEEVFSV